MQIEPVSIQFEIPATDPMGHNHVEGKLRGLDDEVTLHWKIRDRTFNKNSNPMHKIHLPYHEIEDIEFRCRFWSRKCYLIFRVGEPERLEGMPGIEVGKCIFQVEKKSKEDTERLARFLDYKVSEYRRERSEERLNELLGDRGGPEI